MRGKIQTNWSVGYGRRDVWRKEGKATKINPICRCSQHRCWLRGCRPPRMYEYRPCLYFDVALFHSWLQGITSKSVKKSENSLLNPGDCSPTIDSALHDALIDYLIFAWSLAISLAPLRGCGSSPSVERRAHLFNSPQLQSTHKIVWW